MRWVAVLFAFLVLARPAIADAEQEALARIEALTYDQMFGVFVDVVVERSVNCLFTINETNDETEQLQLELIGRWTALVELNRQNATPDVLIALEQKTMNMVIELSERSQRYFSNIVATEFETTFVLPNCVAGLSS